MLYPEVRFPLQQLYKPAFHQAAASDNFADYLRKLQNDGELLLDCAFDDYAAGLFEKCCVPSYINRLDDEICSSPVLNDMLAGWVQILSVSYQASENERGNTNHHDWADTIWVTCVMTAHILTQDTNFSNPFAEEIFTNSLGMSPQEFLDRHYESGPQS